MRIGQGQVDAEWLVGGRVPDQVDRAKEIGPVAVPVDVLAAGIEPTSQERVEGVAPELAAPFLRPVRHEHRPGRLGWPVLDIAIRIESVLAGNEIVLSAPPDEIPVGLERPQQARLVRPQHVVHGPVPAHVGIPPGHERAPAGCTDRVLAERAAERHGVFPDPFVQHGSLGRRIPQVADGIGSPLIGIEQHDMRQTTRQRCLPSSA